MDIFNKIKKFCFVALRIKKYDFLSDCKNVIGKPNKFHPLLLKGKGKIVFGKNVQIGVIASPYFYSHYSYFDVRELESEIILGDNVVINNAFSVVSFSSVVIKNNVLIGSNCSIIDTDGHDLSIHNRIKGKANIAPVLIHENVFIGNNVTILKGVSIGNNSVIGNSSVVTKSIPENVIAAGNPAKIIRSI